MKRNFINKNKRNAVIDDERFKNINKNKLLQPIAMEKKKVVVDKRFASMFTDENFYVKSKFDTRGRPKNFSTKENLEKYYEILNDDVDEESDLSEDDNVDEESGLSEYERNISSGENYDEPQPSTSKGKKNFKKFNSTLDYARGTVELTDSSDDDSSEASSDDESSSESEEEKEFKWGELDADALRDDDLEETDRLAVCNMNWSYVKASDLMVLFDAYLPRGGFIKSITIYPSEFGKKRMTNDFICGPFQSNAQSCDEEDEESDDELNNRKRESVQSRNLEKEKESEMCREYQRNLLKYYYAIVVCDKPLTASCIYSNCDKVPYGRQGLLLDLRYVPNDMTFEEDEAHDICTEVPSCERAKTVPDLSVHCTRPTLTWEEDDPHRKRILKEAMTKANASEEFNMKEVDGLTTSSPTSLSGASCQDVPHLKRDRRSKVLSSLASLKALSPIYRNLIASSSGSEVEEDLEGINGETKSKEERIAKFRELMSELENKGGENEVYLEQAFNEEEKGNHKEKVEEEEIDTGKTKIMRDGKKNKMFKESEEKEDSEVEGYDQNQLQLLMNDTESDKKHFNMRQIMGQYKLTRKQQWRLKVKDKITQQKNKKQEKQDKFEVDLNDTRFSSLTQTDFHIDPSHAQFKGTPAMQSVMQNVFKRKRGIEVEITQEQNSVGLKKALRKIKDNVKR